MCLRSTALTMKNKRVRNKRNSFIPTKVVGVRAENSFWELCASTAERENTTRNDLIVSVVRDYCEKEAEQ